MCDKYGSVREARIDDPCEVILDKVAVRSADLNGLLRDGHRVTREKKRRMKSKRRRNFDQDRIMTCDSCEIYV